MMQKERRGCEADDEKDDDDLCDEDDYQTGGYMTNIEMQAAHAIISAAKSLQEIAKAMTELIILIKQEEGKHADDKRGED